MEGWTREQREEGREGGRGRRGRNRFVRDASRAPETGSWTLSRKTSERPSDPWNSASVHTQLLDDLLCRGTFENSANPGIDDDS